MRTVTIVHHRVRDFDAWKSVYDSVRDVQRQGGVREQAVLRPEDDGSMVVVVHTFDSRDAAQAFFGSPDLQDAMQRAGVDPQSLSVEYLQEVEAGAV